MDTTGFAIFAICGLLYWLTKRRYGFLLFLSGVGLGIVVGAIWAMAIINSLL